MTSSAPADGLARVGDVGWDRDGAGTTPDGDAAPRAAPQGNASGLRVLFVKKGEFSGSNDRLLAGLREVHPDLRIDVLDIRTELIRHKRRLLRLLGTGLLERGLLGPRLRAGDGHAGLDLRARIRNNFIRSPAVFSAVREIVRARTAATRYDFILQTQSLFDASSPGTPQLIYTDHAALARGPNADGAPPDEDWLDRERQIYRNASHIFTFGPHVRTVIVERYGVPADKVTAVGAGIQALAPATVDTSPARYARRRILFVGKAWERKGGPDLLAAFRIARRTVPDAELVIAGTTIPAQEPGVTVLGHMTPEAVSAEFTKASLFCMPSRLEPFGIVIAEAMHHGLPVVSTRIGEIASMIEHGGNGLLVAPHDPEALAEALVELLTDPDKSARFARDGMRRAERYTWSSVAEQMARHFPGASLQ